ncbi:hypothetical protein K435DRAFT_772776 [Dendrothele bispora CBS 962.96]|uniref:DUF6535 domain-containing protein n=1 Tax=Dendrothele bispora (strain CBS 962.96) TaxID=1314807 RepID=A0A4S8MVL7_DENBC|nr:hypothetical protein K435DRAFT_772776 [Dendrothele bispora CBS 962.96]
MEQDRDDNQEVPTKDEPYFYAPPRVGDPWEECKKRMDGRDEELARSWRDDIDALLFFAGLFSAVVTAFTIESYQWLQDDPQDLAVQLLERISQQLGSFNTSSSMDPLTTNTGSSSPSSSSVRVNIFWFLSLTLSLSTALMGLLCKQWIREYRRYSPSSSSQEKIQLSQFRYESFQDWGVTALLALLPILLQTSLLLFFAGIIDLLWSLHHVVAALTTAVIALNVFILVTTTVLPSYFLVTWESSERMFRDKITLCPYKSPQAWLFHRLVLVLPLPSFWNEITSNALDWASAEYLALNNHYSRRFGKRTYLVQAAKWIVTMFSSSLEMFSTTFHCLQDLSVEECMFVLSDTIPSRHQMYYKLYYWMDHHLVVQKFRAECLLRHLNQCLIEQKRQSSFGLEKVESLAVIQTFEPDARLDLSSQLISVIQGLLNNDLMVQEDIPHVLNICRTLWDSPSEEVCSASIGILPDFESWISRIGDEHMLSDVVITAIKILPRLLGTSNSLHLMTAKRKQNSESRLPDAFIRSKEGPDFLRFLDRLLKTKVVGRVNVEGRLIITRWKSTLGDIVRSTDLPLNFFGMPEEEEEFITGMVLSADTPEDG